MTVFDMVMIVIKFHYHVVPGTQYISGSTVTVFATIELSYVLPGRAVKSLL